MSRPRSTPNFENASFEEIKTAMRCAYSKEEYRRLNAVLMFYQEFDYEQVIKISLAAERTLRRWISCFNSLGIDGLLEKKKGKVGRPKKIQSNEIKETIRNAIRNPKSIGEEHVTCVKIHGHLKRQGHNTLNYHDVWREVRANGNVLKFPRSFPEPRDPEEWKKERKKYVEKHINWLEKDDIEVWFLDESGFTGDPRPRRTLAKKGSKIKIGYKGTHIRQSVIGAVCPKSGEFFSHIWDGVNTAVFQEFLNDMAKQIPKKEGVKQIICLDNASWHKSQKLNWHHFEPCFQPSYSPDLNPIEQLWRVIKNRFFASFIAIDRKSLIDRLTLALNHFIQDSASISSTCSYHYFNGL